MKACWDGSLVSDYAAAAPESTGKPLLTGRGPSTRMDGAGSTTTRENPPLKPNTSATVAPEASRVVPVCPECRGRLDLTPAAAACRRCGLSFPRSGETINFFGRAADAHQESQKAIYDGEREAGIHLFYADEEDYGRIVEGMFANLRRAGLPFFTMKDAMNRVMFGRAGFAPGMEVLDIGSGGGFLLNTLARLHGVRGTGVDISELAVARASRRNPHGLRFHLADASKLPFAGASFDRVVSFDVLEHILDQRRAVAEAARVLKPGGRLLFYAVSGLDDHSWHYTQRALTGGRVGSDDGAGHKRELYLDPDAVTGWLHGLGLAGVRVVPFHAFFTLMLDERLLRIVHGLSERPWLFRGAFNLARAADLPWTEAGLGNGFYFLAEKGGA